MKKRQNLRNFFMILSFLLFPITQFYFSPFLIMWGASKGIITASFFVFAMFLFGSLLLGRAFCGWIMPCGGMQEICFQINNRNLKHGISRYIRFVIWIPWITSIVILVLLAGGYNRTEYFFCIDHGISVSNIYMYIPFYIVLFLFFINSIILGKRANCHYICWMNPFMIIGRKIGNVLNVPALRMKVDNKKCINCKICNKVCPMSLNVNDMVRNGDMENSECILCAKCIDCCPNHVINFYFGKVIKERESKCSENIYNKLNR